MRIAAATVRALVCGSRRWPDPKPIAAVLAGLPRDALVITGCADGADRFARHEARRQGLALEVYRADWKAHGRGAGPRRNAEMLRDGKPTIVYAFPLGEARGTGDMMRRATAAGVEVVNVSESLGAGS